MINRANSPQTASAIAVAMEMACAAGDLETAERLFDAFRLLFADYQAHAEPASSVGAPVSRPALWRPKAKVLYWW